MTKAFRGCINYIKDDDEAPKAWAYATHVDLQDLLLTAWQGVRRDLLQTTNESDPILTDIFPDFDPTTDPTTDPPTLVPTATALSSANPSTTALPSANPSAAAAHNEIAGEPGPIPKTTKAMKTGPTTDIRAHFTAMLL